MILGKSSIAYQMPRSAIATTGTFWVTMLSLFLLPAFPIRAGLPSPRVDDVVPLAWALVALSGYVRASLSSISLLRLLFLGLFALSIPISILYGIWAGYDGSSADFIQLFRVAKFASVYVLATSYFALIPDIEIALNRVIYLGLVLLGIAFVQYFDVAGLNALYLPYVAPTQFHTLINDYPHPRPVGMIGNPNELGFLFVLLTIVASYRLSINRHSTGLVLVAIFATGVLITLSRGAMAALIVVAATYAAKLMFRTTLPQLLSRVLLAGIVLIPFYVVLFWTPVYDVITWRFVGAIASVPDGSWEQRLLNWKENIDIIRNTFPFGVGPLRNVHFKYAADNEWLLLLRSYGVLGIAAILGLLVVPIPLLRNSDAQTAALALTLATFLYMVPAAAFHSLALFSVVVVLLAATDVAKPGQTYARTTQDARHSNMPASGVSYLKTLQGALTHASVLRHGAFLIAVGLFSFTFAEVWPRVQANWPQHSVLPGDRELAERTLEKYRKDMHPSDQARNYTAAGPYMGYGKQRLASADSFTISDAEGLLMLKRGEALVYDPVITAQQALAEYSQPAGPAPMFLKVAEKLLSMQDNRGALPRTFPFSRNQTNYQPGWVSAQAQGQALSVFARAYHITNDARYLIAGEAALLFLSMRFESGGPMATMVDLEPTLSQFTFFMDCPSDPAEYSLAGHMYAMIGLYDWRVLASSHEATLLFDKALATLLKILPYYDMGVMSSSDLSHLTMRERSPTPRIDAQDHVIHIEQLRALAVTAQPLLKELADKWTGDLN